MAWIVGRMSSLTLCRSASRCTSFITGNLPYAPVPTTSRWHFQGISSSAESGVCPKSSRNFLDGFFWRLRTLPRSMITSCSYVLPSIRREPKEKFSNCIFMPSLGSSATLDFDERFFVRHHPPRPWNFPSGAFLGGNDGESRPELLHILAAAAWAGNSTFLNSQQEPRPLRMFSCRRGRRIRSGAYLLQRNILKRILNLGAVIPLLRS